MSNQKNKTASLIVFALVFLFNPNIQIVDLLPDFVAYFIFARLLEKPALMAPYFEEARSSALKLAFLTLAKAPAFVLAIFIRSRNTLDNDIFPMLSLVFAALEILLTFGFIKNISTAFFHLGERGTASALIKPFTLSKLDKREMRPEELKNLTIFFVITKCLLYTLPEFLLLTRTAANGLIMPSPLSRFYPITLLLALALGFFIGSAWLRRSKKFLEAVLQEGEFTASLNFLKSETSEKEYERNLKLRATNRAFMTIAVASIFTYPMIFEDAELINIFPGFIFASLLIFPLFRLRRAVKESFLPQLISGAVYAFASLVAFVLSANFLKKYDYIDIANTLSSMHNSVKSAYVSVVITAGIELIAFAFLAVSTFFYLNSFIKENTGLSPDSERYSRTEREYHKSLKIRLSFFVGFAFLQAALKFIEIYLYLEPKIHFSVTNGQVSPVTSSALPWFGVVVTIFSILFIGYTFYFTHVLREEVEMKLKNV